MRFKTLFICAIFCFASKSVQADSDYERSLSRITALWKDAQVDLVKEQAKAFLSNYPESKGTSIVRMALADAYRSGQEYAKVLKVIQAIPKSEQTVDIKIIYLDAHYHLKNYNIVSTLSESILKGIDSDSAPDEKRALVCAYAGLSLLSECQEKEPDQKKLKKAHALLNQTSACPKAWETLVQKSEIEVLRLMGNVHEAGQKALALSKTLMSEKDALIFMAARCFMQTDPSLSLTLYEKLIDSKSALCQKSAEGLMHLLIQSCEPNELINRRQMLKKHLSAEATDNLTFFLAQAYFQKGDYLKVFHLLQKPLKKITPTQKRRSQVYAAYAAHKIGNHSKKMELLGALFSYRELSKAETELALLCAKSALEEGDPRQAERTLVQLKKRRYCEEAEPSIQLIEAAIAYESNRFEEAFNLALDLMENDKVQKKDLELLKSLIAGCASKTAYDCTSPKPEALQRFITMIDMDQIPLSPKLILSYLDALAAYREFDKMNSFFMQRDLETVPFSKNERFHLELKKAQSSEETEQFEHQLSALNRAYKEATSLGNLEKFQSLILLFNANYNLHRSTNQSAKNGCSDYLDSAADLLREAYTLESSRISSQNKKWLGYYLAKQLNQVVNGEACYLSIDKIRNCHGGLVLLSQDNSLEAKDLGQIALQLAQIHRKSHEKSKGYFSKVLSSCDAKDLITHAESLNEIGFEVQSLQSALYLEAGLIYELLNDHNDAKKCYEKAISKTAIGIEADMAKLFLSRIDMREKTKDLNSIIATLKGLQSKKSAIHEPLFLEAALDYIDASIVALQGKEKLNKELFLFKRLQEDFTERDSAIGNNYHNSLNKLPEKLALYTKYMGYVNSKIAYLSSLQQEKLDSSLEKTSKAITNIRKLIEMPKANESYTRIDERLRNLLKETEMLGF